ncbi:MULTISPECIES: sugar kinase [unclassified Enterococcus]|uniref:sugar kinase n=1 Tax=unclassified Enterococcus TaxID=2608891 RepID=UPI000A34083D|nr:MULTISPECIES: sugar kinase [unclassified Enterococcus]
MSKILTLGEVMLRFSTTENMRLSESSQFEANYGGGEANVAISLANYGHNVSFASKVPDNVLGTAVKSHLLKYGVEVSHLLIGGERLGSYYLEVGIGLRASNVVYDRKYSSFAMIEDLEWNLDRLFENVSVFHISGITPALSSEWRLNALMLMREAKARGIAVSLDINYRGKLWTLEDCGNFVREAANYVDYLSAGHLDALNFFNIENKLTTEEELQYFYSEIVKLYPEIKVIYSTTREIINANHNKLKGNLFLRGKLYYSQEYDIPYIVDRVGGGDAYAGGILHGILTNKKPEAIVEFATVASAMKHTVHGDHNQFSKEEIEEIMKTGVKEIRR